MVDKVLHVVLSGHLGRESHVTALRISLFLILQADGHSASNQIFPLEME